MSLASGSTPTTTSGFDTHTQSSSVTTQISFTTSRRATPLTETLMEFEANASAMLPSPSTSVVSTTFPPHVVVSGANALRESPVQTFATLLVPAATAEVGLAETLIVGQVALAPNDAPAGHKAMTP